MKLWGWWRKEKGPEPASELRQEPEILDDLPPKFEDNTEAKLKAHELSRPSLSQTLKSIGVEDLKAMPQVPCFRNAMLTGLGIGVTAGGVMFLSRRSISRSVNWVFGGFFVGSVLSWEQCRFRNLRGKRNVRKAQEAYKSKDEGTKPANE